MQQVLFIYVQCFTINNHHTRPYRSIAINAYGTHTAYHHTHEFNSETPTAMNKTMNL